MSSQSRALIAVDMDDVLFDFLGEFFNWHNNRFETSYRPSDMIYEKLWQVWGGEKEEALEKIHQFWQEIDLLNVTPIPDSVRVLNEIKERFDLAVVSARFSSTKRISEQWLNKYFPKTFKQIFLGVSDPMGKEIPLRKADLCKEIGASFLIDDQTIHAIECSKLGINVFLFGDSAHNQMEKLPDGVKRVGNWSEIAYFFSLPAS